MNWTSNLSIIHHHSIKSTETSKPQPLGSAKKTTGGHTECPQIELKHFNYQLPGYLAEHRRCRQATRTNWFKVVWPIFLSCLGLSLYMYQVVLVPQFEIPSNPLAFVVAEGMTAETILYSIMFLTFISLYYKLWPTGLSNLWMDSTPRLNNWLPVTSISSVWVSSLITTGSWLLIGYWNIEPSCWTEFSPS